MCPVTNFRFQAFRITKVVISKSDSDGNSHDGTATFTYLRPYVTVKLRHICSSARKAYQLYYYSNQFCYVTGIMSSWLHQICPVKLSILSIDTFFSILRWEQGYPHSTVSDATNFARIFTISSFICRRFSEYFQIESRFWLLTIESVCSYLRAIKVFVKGLQVFSMKWRLCSNNYAYAAIITDH